MEQTWYMSTMMLRLLLPLLIAAQAWGQSLEFAVAYPALLQEPRLAEILLNDFSTDGGTASLRFAGGDQLQLGVRLREAGSLATIGNLVTSLSADGSTAGRYSLSLAGRGTLGPAAIRLRASLFDGLPPLTERVEGSLGELPLLGAGPPVLGIELGVGYRVSRTLIVDAAPAFLLRAGELGGALAGEVRLVRAVGDDDLSFLAHAFAEPGFEQLSVAVGAGYTLNRRRAPSWSASAWLGWGRGGLAPGIRVDGAERLGNGNLNLSAAAEPYRLGAMPYRLELDYSHELGTGQALVDVEAGLWPERGWGLMLRTGYRLPLDR